MRVLPKAASAAMLGIAMFQVLPAWAQTDVVTNGQFAGLTGWTTSVSTTGSASGTCGFNGVTAPGTEALTSTAGFPAADSATTTIALGSVSETANGFRSCVLYQDVAIPAGATTATLMAESGIKLIGGLASGNTAIFIGLYPTTSVPSFQDGTFVGSRLIVPGANDTTLSAGSVSVNVSSVAGTTVRLAIINAMQSLSSGTGAFVPGANSVIGIGNIRLNVTVPVPTVTSLAPTTAGTAGGGSVTITGTNFTGATAVKFGTTAATFTVVNATTITATIPAGSAGTVDVTVTAPGGTSAVSAADHFTYTALPIVTGLSPATGLPAGGQSITITGSNFTGATAVKFGTTAATFTVVNATTITATIPVGSAGTVDVTVTAPGGTSAVSAADQFTYTALPIVTGLSPATGPPAGGQSITITGTNFTGATAVKFGTTAATFTVVNATTITATIPAGSAGTVDVTVTTPGGTSAVSAADQFTYTALPIVTGLSPATGPPAGGQSITITGSNFTGATAVKFGTTAATFTVVNATTITATIPAGSAGTVDVTVTTPGGTSVVSAADQFAYAAALSVPTLGTWSMIALGVMLAWAGCAVIRSRETGDVHDR